ncbi:MAG TPA: amino acid ABC transporter substrate-binding protein [Methylomirabilota bacterium]
MTRSSVRSTLLVALLLSAGCASTSATDGGKGTLDRIKTSKSIALGYRQSSVPFSAVGADGKPVGYSIDLCTQVANDIGRDLGIADLAVKWVPVSVESRMAAVRDGTIDLECGSTTNTLSRQAEVDFSLTTFITGGSLLSLQGTSLSDLAGLRIAVIPGTTTERVLKEALEKAPAADVRLVPVKDHAEGRTAIENRAADAYASDRDILIGLALTASDPRRFVLADRYFSYEPYALMLRRGDLDFRLAVNRSLARFYRSGQILTVYSRWFGALGDPNALIIAMYAIEGLPD